MPWSEVENQHFFVMAGFFLPLNIGILAILILQLTVESILEH